MATTTKHTSPTFDAAFEQFKELNDQFMDVARKAGLQSVDTYAKAADRAIDLERRLADTTKQEWLKSLIESHADFAHELTEAYTNTARGLLK